MNRTIHSSNYLFLTKKESLDKILDNMFNKKHPYFNSKSITFELEFRLLNKYIDLNV